MPKREEIEKSGEETPKGSFKKKEGEEDFTRARMRENIEKVKRFIEEKIEGWEKYGLVKDLEKIEKGAKNGFEVFDEEVARAIGNVFGFLAVNLDMVYRRNREKCDKIIKEIIELIKEDFKADIEVEMEEAPFLQPEEELRIDTSEEDHIRRCTNEEKEELRRKYILFMFLAEGYAREIVREVCELYEERLKEMDEKFPRMIEIFFDFGEVANYFQYKHPPENSISGGTGIIKITKKEEMVIDENNEIKEKKEEKKEAKIKASSFHVALVELGELEFVLIYPYIDEFLKYWNKEDIREVVEKERNKQFLAYLKGPEYYERLKKIKGMIKGIIENKWPDTKTLVTERWFYYTLQSLNGEEIKKVLGYLDEKDFKRSEVEKIITQKFEELIKEHE